jgi:hypothetical protein
VQTQNTPALSKAVRFALSRDAVIVAAGGNDGPDTGTGPFYPASYPGVLSVGTVESDGSLAPFSDLGSNVALTAPGVNGSRPMTARPRATPANLPFRLHGRAACCPVAVMTPSSASATWTSRLPVRRST